MAHFETERYYESDKNLPKIDQSDFCINPSFEVEPNTELLLNHLKTLEPTYHEHIIVNGNKPDARVCNEIFFSCMQLFSTQLDICVIYNEIIDFFGFDNKYFYTVLSGQFKRKLKTALSKRVSLDTFERVKIKEEASQGGAYIPSFTSLFKKK